MDPFEGFLIGQSLTRYLGGSLEKFPDRYVKASPGSYVTKDTSPTFLVHGTKDKLVPIAQSRSYESLLKKKGVDVSLWEAPGEGHDFVGKNEQKALDAMFEFLDKRLKREVVADAQK
jgi:dipeptidyl aminopeptidase/acylaminoacyl peptidase